MSKCEKKHTLIVAACLGQNDVLQSRRSALSDFFMSSLYCKLQTITGRNYFYLLSLGIAGARVIIKVSGHQYQWLSGVMTWK